MPDVFSLALLLLVCAGDKRDGEESERRMLERESVRGIRRRNVRVQLEKQTFSSALFVSGLLCMTEVFHRTGLVYRELLGDASDYWTVGGSRRYDIQREK